MIADVNEPTDEEPHPFMDDNEAPQVKEDDSKAEEEDYEEISDQDDYTESDIATDSIDNEPPTNKSLVKAPSAEDDIQDKVDLFDESYAKAPSIEDEIQDKSAPSEEAKHDSAALLSKGMEFLGGLSKVLSTSESRKRFVDDIVKEDPQTGQKSISIPVGSKEAVENVLGMIVNLFSGLR